MEIEIIVRSDTYPRPTQYDPDNTVRDNLAQLRVAADDHTAWSVFAQALFELTKPDIQIAESA